MDHYHILKYDDTIHLSLSTFLYLSIYVFNQIYLYQVWIKIPLVLENEIMIDESSSITWERWNKFRVLCEHNVKLSIGNKKKNSIYVISL